MAILTCRTGFQRPTVARSRQSTADALGWHPSGPDAAKSHISATIVATSMITHAGLLPAVSVCRDAWGCSAQVRLATRVGHRCCAMLVHRSSSTVSSALLVVVRKDPMRPQSMPAVDDHPIHRARPAPSYSESPYICTLDSTSNETSHQQPRARIDREAAPRSPIDARRRAVQPVPPPYRNQRCRDAPWQMRRDRFPQEW